jgi:HEAT repeat protein
MRRNKKMMGTVLFLAVLLVGAMCGQCPARSETDKKVDSLFIIASSGEIKYRDMVAPAIDSLVAMGKPAVPRLLELYDTQVARERHALNTILEKIGHDAVPYLIKALNTTDVEKLSRLCYTLGNIKDSAAVDALMKKASHDDWGVRSNAVTALGQIGDKKGAENVIRALQDSVETVRKSAAVAAGRMILKEAIKPLVHMLGDKYYGPRMAAADALLKMPDFAAHIISDSLHSSNELLGNLGITLLGQIGGDAAAYRVGRELESQSPIRRALAAEAIYNSNSSLGCGFIEILIGAETDSTVLFFMNRVLEKYAP